MNELIDQNTNTQLHNFNTKNTFEYIKSLEDFYIYYLDLLNIKQSYTFGTEIEYKNIYKYKVDKFVKNNIKKWNSIYEPNISIGGEIISPILKDNKTAWNELSKICSYLRENEAIMDTGGHIHIGSQILGLNSNNWIKFIKLYCAFENIIYRFSNGEQINGRPTQISNAAPMAISLSRKCCSLQDINLNNIKEMLKVYDRFNGINFKNIKWNTINIKSYKNTIEFRMPNGSFNEEIWQNNIYFFIKLLEAAKGELDIDLIDYRLSNVKKLTNYSSYYKMDIKSALLLADIIFNNNFDKARFMKQYIKDGFETESNKLTDSTKILIKKRV